MLLCLWLHEDSHATVPLYMGLVGTVPGSCYTRAGLLTDLMALVASVLTSP